MTKGKQKKRQAQLRRKKRQSQRTHRTSEVGANGANQARGKARGYSGLSNSDNATETSRLLPRLKREPTSVFRAVVGSAPHPRLVQRLLGNPFPRGYEQLIQPVTTRTAASTRLEALWLARTLALISSELSDFIRESSDFEGAFLRGKFDQASNALESIRAKFGYSMWLMAAELLLAESKGGLAANRELLQQIRERVRHPLAGLFAEFLSQRAETQTTYKNYDLAFQSFLRQQDKSSLRDPIFDSIRFHLHFPAFRNLRQLRFVLWHSGTLSAVDRYETLVRCLQLIAAHLPSQTQLIGDCAAILSGIHDSRLMMLAFYADPQSVQHDVTDEERMLSDAVEAYTVGDYKRSASLAGQGISAAPAMFEFYELYANARLNAENPDEIQRLPSGSLSQQVCDHIVNILARGKQTSDSMQASLAIASSLSSMWLGRRLFTFVLEVRIGTQSFRTLGLLQTSIATPRFSLVYAEHSKARQFLALAPMPLT
jgi:hypothetical protein